MLCTLMGQAGTTFLWQSRVSLFAGKPDMTAASRKLWSWKLHVMSQSSTSDAPIECIISAHLKYQGFVLRLDLIPVYGNACAWLGRVAAGCGLERSLSSQELSPITAQPTTKADKCRLVCNGCRLFVACHLMMHNGMYNVLLVDAG